MKKMCHVKDALLKVFKVKNGRNRARYLKNVFVKLSKIFLDLSKFIDRHLDSQSLVPIVQLRAYGRQYNSFLT